MTRSFNAIAEQHVPETLILPPVESSVERVLDELGLPVVVKEPRSSMGRGVSLIESPSALRSWTRNADVLYAQQYLAIDGDVRVVFVGDRVLSAYWRRGGDGFRHNLAQGAEAVFDNVPAAATQLVQRIAPQLGIDHAGFDVAMVDGHPYLIEFNVLFGNEALNGRGVRVEPAILDYLQRTLRPQDNPSLPLLPQAV
jgi:ribosomal protein S6--L-glutamate ligase